jgi:hypothetical protein
MSRTFPLWWRMHVALIAPAVALVLAAPAEAQRMIGGQLLATGGTVDVVVQPATAAFTSQLFLLHRDGTTRENIALNTEVGKHVTVGPFPAGQELVFGITVLDGPTFLMGPASRNPDGIAHAEVTETGVRTFLVGFEDASGGGDRDYDDTLFQFTGNLAPTPPPPADDPPLTNPTPAPKPNVPPLTISEARRRLPTVLRKRYGMRYTSRRGPLKRSCYRLASERVRCRVSWNTRRDRYSGKATMWHDRDDAGSILFTTSIRRTRSRTAASRHTR